MPLQVLMEESPHPGQLSSRHQGDDIDELQEVAVFYVLNLLVVTLTQNKVYLILS